MGKPRHPLKWLASAFAKGVIATALALSPALAYASDADPGAVDASHEATTPAHVLRDDYVEANVDEDLTCPQSEKGPVDAFLGFLGFEADALTETHHTLYIKNTLYDEQAAGSDTTLDGIYARDDWMSIVYGQYDSSEVLLDPGPDSGSYVAVVNAAASGSMDAPTDHVFAELSNNGVVIEDASFDASTGLAYVPKSLYSKDGEDIPYALQLQLFTPVSAGEAIECETDVSVSNNDPRVKSAGQSIARGSATDVTTKVQVSDAASAKHLSLDDIHVKLNGSDEELELEDGVNASWDSSTGQLEILESPQSLARVDVTTDAPSILELFAEPAEATSTSDLAYVPEVVFDSLNLDTLTPGRYIPFGSYINYWWPNAHPDDTFWHSCVNTGSYCYSWITDPDSLYEYLAYSNGADWNGVSEKDVSNFHVDPNGSQASRHYFNYVFAFGSYDLEDQYFHSDRWPVNNPGDTGYVEAGFGLQCSHVRNPVGDGVDSDNYGRMGLRILDVNTTADRPYVVIGFVGPSFANQPGVGIYKFQIEARGDIELIKSSGAIEMTSENPSYQMEGIRYDIYSDASCTSYVTTVTLGSDGRGKSCRLQDGTYYVRENAASVQGKGFAYDPTVRAVAVTSGNTSSLSVADTPQSYPLELLLQKHDSVNANSTPQGDASLEGAVFEVRHYKGDHASTSELQGLQPSRTWQMRTDAEGKVLFDEAHKVSGDAFFTDSQGRPCLPLGTISVREVSAPDGYRIDSTERLIRLTSQGTAESIAFTQTQTVPEDVKRGGVSIQKLDAESLLEEPLGGASLDGAQFEVRNESDHSVCVDGVMHAPGEVVAKIVSSGGYASTEASALPFGTYSIKEVAAGTGYLVDDEVRTFSITEDEQMVTLSGDDAAKNQVKRGDLDFRKILQADQSRLANIPFSLRSKTTGETHVVVTDANGIVDTSASWHPHTYLTNGNDWALDASHSEAEDADGSEQQDALIDPTKLDPECGTWFGLAPDGTMTDAQDALGALPYDSYDLTELRAENNAKFEMIQIEGIRITSDGVKVPLGDIENRLIPPPAITTFAKNADDSSKLAHATDSVRISDRVDYCNLEPGRSYEVFGQLMDAETGEQVLQPDGIASEAHLAFTAAASSGNCEMLFEADATNLAGKRLVCFEQLVDAETGKVLAIHEELDDYGQSIDVAQPKVSTYATSEADSKDIISDELIVLDDAVNYTGLEPGAEYTLIGTLMRKVSADEGVRAEAVLDEDGQPCTSTTTFTPDTPTGKTTVSFSVSSEHVEDGSELVVFETLVRDGKEIVVHEDPENDAQTVRVRTPELATNAYVADSGDQKASPAPNMELVDEVAYGFLTPNETYTIFGTLMRRVHQEDGSVQAEPLLDAKGNKVTSSETFSPSTTSGSAFVSFDVDASQLAGQDIVVFERLVSNGKVIATHEDAASESQTVSISEPKEPAQQNPKGLTALPQTGDEAPLAAALTLAVCALALITTLITRRRSAQRRCASDQGDGTGGAACK